MAVEARHLSLFPSRMLTNREMTMNCVDNMTGNIVSQQVGYGVMAPSQRVFPTVNTVAANTNNNNNNLVPTMKSESVVTSALALSRKRSRDAMAMINPNALTTFQNLVPVNHQNTSSLSFLGEDISFQIQQQQLEIDRFIAQHNENVRIEVEQRRKRHCERIAAAMEHSMMKRLKEKEVEIEKIRKLNWALEERVKSLCMENQIWKDMAQSNEATANALRSNLEQVLAQVQHAGGNAADDESSCCGSSGGGGGEEKKRGCKKCGKEEACVLILPCRHLCLCTVCGATLHTCPVCNAVKTASVHVNFSES